MFEELTLWHLKSDCPFSRITGGRKVTVRSHTMQMSLVGWQRGKGADFQDARAGSLGGRTGTLGVQENCVWEHCSSE